MFLIDDVIQATLRKATPNRGDDLAGFLTDLDYAFESEPLFGSFTVEQTNDPACMIRVCVVAQDDENVPNALRKAWSWLAYETFQATAIARSPEAVVMRFVTASADGGLCVTGEVIATL